MLLCAPAPSRLVVACPSRQNSPRGVRASGGIIAKRFGLSMPILGALGDGSRSDRLTPMELIGRMMDGSISYDDRALLEPVRSASGIRQDEKMERLEAVPLFEACTRRQLRAVARIAEIFDAPASTILIRAGDPGEEFFL